jgi:hypothetical protein
MAYFFACDRIDGQTSLANAKIRPYATATPMSTQILFRRPGARTKAITAGAIKDKAMTRTPTRAGQSTLPWKAISSSHLLIQKMARTDSLIPGGRVRRQEDGFVFMGWIGQAFPRLRLAGRLDARPRPASVPRRGCVFPVRSGHEPARRRAYVADGPAGGVQTSEGIFSLPPEKPGLTSPGCRRPWDAARHGSD